MKNNMENFEQQSCCKCKIPALEEIKFPNIENKEVINVGSISV